MYHSERERKRERKVSFGGAKQKKSVKHLLKRCCCFSSHRHRDVYAYAFERKDGDFCLFFCSSFGEWRRFCLHRLCAYIKINRAYTFLSQTPTLRPAKNSFVTCNAFNAYSFVWFCRAIARSSSPRSSLNVTSAFKDYTKHGGAFLPLTDERPRVFDFSFSLHTRREKTTREFCAFKEELDGEDKVVKRRCALTCV